jgi:hypothetical protein
MRSPSIQASATRRGQSWTASCSVLRRPMILRHARRRLITINFTTNPIAEWIASQVTDAFT